MEVFTTIDQKNLNLASSSALGAEALGFDGIYTLENKHDPYLPLASATVTTEKISLLTGIALSFTRSPMLTANLAWDLQVSSDGRFVLGLGPQIKAHNVRRFSVPWSAPAPRMKEYVLAIRHIWNCWKNGAKLDFQGKFYKLDLMPPNFVPEKSNVKPPPIFLGAVGPSMMQVAGEVADGVILHPLCTEKYYNKVVLPNLTLGLKKAKKKRENFKVVGGRFFNTGRSEDDVNLKRKWARERIAFYSSTPAYWPVLESEGIEELGPVLRDLTRQGKWSEMAGIVPENFVEACCLNGTHTEIAEHVNKKVAQQIDTILVSQSYEQQIWLPTETLNSLRSINTPFKKYI